MASVERLQERILELADLAFPAEPISPAARAAFMAVPRHRFVRRFLRGSEAVDVTPGNLPEHLRTIYDDGVLVLWSDRAGGVFSTISQPTLVLRMLDLLELEPGLTVFELGAGSGWNAAMMGSMVGPRGRVFSSEIIPEMAEAAEQAILDCGIANVRIVRGDGGAGHAAGAPYDRIVFTAGSYDLPLAFHEQIRLGGLLLLVIKMEGGGDQLVLFERKAGWFESRCAIPCAFVPMTGAHAFAPGDPAALDSLPDWPELARREVGRIRLDLGDAGMRFFLGISEPDFRVFKEAAPGRDPRRAFLGIHDRAAGSLAIVRDGMVVGYGSPAARDRLLARLKEWAGLGMPGPSAMSLRIYPAGAEVPPGPRQWIARRRDSQFVWKL